MANLLLATALINLTFPQVGRGYADYDPFRLWLAKAPTGVPVTPQEHNAMVAQLAWAKDIIARKPQDVPRLRDNVPFNHAVSSGAEPTLMLGAVPYEAGDIELPAAPVMAPAGSVVMPPNPATRVTVTDAKRRAAFDNADRCLKALELQPSQVILVDQTVQPAGYIWPAVVVAVAGIAAFSAWQAHVQATQATADGRVREARIQEEQNTARVVAQLNAQNAALAARLAHAQQTGELPPPSPMEEQPVQTISNGNGRDALPDTGGNMGIVIAGGATLGLVAAVGAYAAYDQWQDNRALRRLAVR